MSRTARLLRADINALLDRFEAPELMLSQALRDMEQALDQDRQALARLEPESRALEGRESELKRLLAIDEAALGDCLDAGQEDLARSVIRRRLERERQLDWVRRAASRIGESRDALGRAIGLKAARLAELRARASLYEEAQPSDSADDGMSDDEISSRVRDTDVEVALLRAKRSRGEAS